MKRQILHSALFAIVAIMLFALPQHAQAKEKEAYVVKSTDGKTLTFYYDTQKARRPGTKWGIEEKHKGTSIPAWAGTGATPNRTITKAVIASSFKDFRPKTTACWFNRLQALTQITGIENLNTSEVTDMSYMFYCCDALTRLDVTKFDTKNVTDMHNMFAACKALTQLDVSKFDTKNVTDMAHMFDVCKALTRLDVSQFKTQNVTDMSYMFCVCEALTQLDVSNFVTENVTDMSSMFYGCDALTRLDVTKFKTQNVTDMRYMFGRCAALTRLDVSNFNTANVTDMEHMFYGCKTLTQLDVSKFVTKNVTDMSSMFDGCAALTTIYCNDAWTCNKSDEMFANCLKLKGAASYDKSKIDVAMANPETGYFTKKANGNREAYVVKSDDGKTLTFYYDTQKATRPGDKWGINETQTDNGITLPAWSGTNSNPNTTTTQAVIDPSFKDFRPKTTAKWFYYFNTLEQITGIEHLNTSEVTEMIYMFYNCSSLTQLDVTKFDTKNVTDMNGMFAGCSSLTQLDVTKFDTKNVTYMSWMFAGCSSLTQLDVTKFDTKNVTEMGVMFAGCTALTQLDVTNFDTKSVTEMNGMFDGCKALTQLDVTKFDTNNVTEMIGMFFGCSALTQLDVTNFDTQNVTKMNGMFNRCSSLTQLDVTNFDTQNVTNMGGMFFGCSALTTIYCNDTWTCNKSDEMFANCLKLKGAASYDKSKIDVAMANPETGYFTKKANGNREAYVVKSDDGKTLTFYYDTQKATRPGDKWGINETQTDNGITLPAWSGTYSNPNTTTTQGVIDPSFKDFRPTTTAKWFYYFNTLEQITGLENLNTSEVTNMSGMFDGCASLTSINMSKTSQAKVSDLANAGLRKAPAAANLLNFNTANVTDMSYMFAGCSSLTILDLTSFDTKNVTDMSYMFSGCSSLTTIYCNDVWTCGSTDKMFYGCEKLKGAVEYAESNSNETMLNPETGYFTKKGSTGIAQTGRAATVKTIYSIDGRRLKETRPGVNIVKMSDGTTRKIIKK